MNISVCIPTYNQAQYLESAIRSAANQNLMPFEIIVFDDCSTDNTKEILSILSKEIPILKIKHQPDNFGITKNTDSCLRAAKGDFIVRLDSDDLLGPSYIDTLANLLIKYPNAAYSHAKVQEIDKCGNFTKERKLFRKAGFQSDADALKSSIKGYRVAANIIMFRREALEKVDYLANRPGFAEDFHLACALASAGFGNVYHDDILSSYRVWTDTKRIRQKRKLMEIEGLTRVFEDVIEPAFMGRGWSIKSVKKNKANLACNQTDCLGWEIYTPEEKKELADALLRFSPSLKTKLYMQLHLFGYANLIHSYSRSISFIKSIIKKTILA
ncbi:MAG: glycosyltransferase [Bacteroidota bacterium]|nr:glycosyltransferase [Bacteroidota bacterium]